MLLDIFFDKADRAMRWWWRTAAEPGEIEVEPVATVLPVATVSQVVRRMEVLVERETRMVEVEVGGVPRDGSLGARCPTCGQAWRGGKEL